MGKIFLKLWLSLEHIFFPFSIFQMHWTTTLILMLAAADGICNLTHLENIK